MACATLSPAWAKSSASVTFAGTGQVRLVVGGRVKLAHGPSEHGQRPALARVIPHACRDDPAGPGDPPHLPQAQHGIRHEVHDQLRQRGIEAPSGNGSCSAADRTSPRAAVHALRRRTTRTAPRTDRSAPPGRQRRARLGSRPRPRRTDPEHHAASSRTDHASGCRRHRYRHSRSPMRLAHALGNPGHPQDCSQAASLSTKALHQIGVHVLDLC